MIGFWRFTNAEFVSALYKIPGEQINASSMPICAMTDARLVLWLPFHETRPVFNLPLKQFVDTFAAKWEQPNAWSDRLASKFLDYHFEDHSADDDPLQLLGRGRGPRCDIHNHDQSHLGGAQGIKTLSRP